MPRTLQPPLVRASMTPVFRREHPPLTLVLLFVLLIASGMLLLRLPACSHGDTSWSTAAFTATSAVCVTGLAVVDTATHWTPLGQAVILLLIQAGGLGYMTASTLLIVFLRRQPSVHSRLLLRDTLGEITLKDTLRVLYSAVWFTLAVEALGAVILTARFALEPGRSFGDALWRGVFHSVSAFCNAGFDLFGKDGHAISSLGGYQGDWVVNLTVAALIIIGGLGFTVCLEVGGHRPGKFLSLHSRIVLSVTAALIISGTLLVLGAEWSNAATLGELPLGQKLLVSFFQSVTLRTAGFATVDFGALRSITLMIMGVYMVVGASPAGTGGGIKTTTLAVTLAAVRASLLGRSEVEMFRRHLPAESVYRALTLIVLSVGILIAGTFALVFTEPEALTARGVSENLFIRIQFEAMSAFGTVGISTGITHLMSETGRLVLILLMFIGRLGPVTLANAWIRPRSEPNRHYPTEKVPLG
ncbi:MAG: TrkH family potassium uptake protein [Actinomycetota bacterium]